jgi:hypothetical protein
MIHANKNYYTTMRKQGVKLLVSLTNNDNTVQKQAH